MGLKFNNSEIHNSLGLIISLGRGRSVKKSSNEQTQLDQRFIEILYDGRERKKRKSMSDIDESWVNGWLHNFHDLQYCYLFV